MREIEGDGLDNFLRRMLKGGILSLLPAPTVFAADPAYKPVPGDANSGYFDEYDSDYGVEYGKARIEYRYRHDASGYWYYAYKIFKIFNNDYYRVGMVLGTDCQENNFLYTNRNIGGCK